MSATIAELDAVDGLRTALRGAVLGPADAGYDAARRVWNGLIDRRPALIARCTGTADVVAAIDFARTQRLPLAVRGGGHNVAGTAVCDGGLVLDLSPLRGVHVDPVARTVRVQGGATWGDVDRETQVFGLATAGGVVSTTGVAGLTLGGGLGWLRRAHGLSCDNLVSVDVVTADGRCLTASETQHPDLFWAVRGGGGNFGVVTSFEFRLHPVGPTVYLGAPMYAADSAARGAALVRAWRDVLAGAPDEVSAECLIWTVPDVEAFPAAARGRPVIAMPAVYCGPVADGERLLRPLRELEAPLVDLSGPMPYADLQTAFDWLFPSGILQYYWKSLYLGDLAAATVDAIVGRGLDRPSPRSLVAIWHLGGAMGRVPGDATAFGRRDAPYLLSLDSTWEAPQDADRNVAWTRAFWEAMRPFSSGRSYLNFPGLGEEQEALVRAAYGANYDRLVAIKSEYDPSNHFRSNQNIVPRGMLEG
jgi:FAD/FMN-containing dehydrogenase